MGIAGRSASPLRVVLVAGEASGDALGAGLIRAIRERIPAARFFGVAGEQMRREGCEAWHGVEELSVMGLAEVLPHLRRLLALRRGLVERIGREQPDLFVGIDSPDFNLPLAKRLKRAGIKTVQYVSPQVWAWRESRVTGIRAAIDLVLCVLPFEVDFYAARGVPAVFVGHPLADAIPLASDPARARAALGLADGSRVLAILPGSRRSEVRRLGGAFLATAAWVRRHCAIEIVVALANADLGSELAAASDAVALDPPARVVAGRAREVIAAADVVLTASGTATLEAMLVKRPMVVAYRLAPVTYWILRALRVLRVRHFSLPNLLAGRRVVAEFRQAEVRPEILGPAVLDCFEGRLPDPHWRAEFEKLHEILRRDADRAAAAAVLELAGAGTGAS